MFRIIFFGTSSFAVPSLERLIADPRFEVVAVVTQPDRPVGRKMILTPPPVKEAAMRHRIPVLQYEKVKSDEAYEELKKISSDVGVVASFGQILSERVLGLPTRGMINVHGSLLPNYRGASPVAAAILNGDTKTGVTFMIMDAMLDHGDILAAVETVIAKEETAGVLHDRLAIIGAEHLPDLLIAYLEGHLRSTPQQHSAASFTKSFVREDGRIDWRRSVVEVERMIRAYQPWPECFTVLDEQRLKIHRARIGGKTAQPVGTFFEENGWPAFACGDGIALILLDVQQEGRKRMDGQTFLRGRRSTLPSTSTP